MCEVHLAQQYAIGGSTVHYLHKYQPITLKTGRFKWSLYTIIEAIYITNWKKAFIQSTSRSRTGTLITTWHHFVWMTVTKVFSYILVTNTWLHFTHYKEHYIHTTWPIPLLDIHAIISTEHTCYYLYWTYMLLSLLNIHAIYLYWTYML